MPAPTPPSRIFLSYARRDGGNLAIRLQAELEQCGFDAWLDKERLTGGRSWTREIEIALDEADHVLALLTRGSYESEICRAEQLRALRKGKRVIPIRAQTDADIPLHLEPKNYRDFTDLANYASQFKLLLTDIAANISVTCPEQYRQTPLRYVTAPPRVANYLHRPELLATLRDAVFAEDNRQPIALTALVGMGGIGKTVLAKALSEDRVIQDAFPDGIVWITVGRDRTRDFVQDMREVAKALGDGLMGYDTPDACRNRYRTVLSEKAALIIVDDVWSKADIEPLLADSPRSRFLFTTRDQSIGRFLAAQPFQADLLEPSQARQLIAQWANLSPDRLPPTAEGILAECNRLPLALSIIGAMLRGEGEPFWESTLRLLQNADLSAIEDQLPEGQQSFVKAAEVSFQSLKPALQQYYRSLAVLLEDTPAHPIILQTLWNLSSDETIRIAKQLTDRSLALPDAATGGITLHDLQLDFVRGLHPDSAALKLIRGASRLSLNVIAQCPEQFASQVVGRLLPHQSITEVAAYMQQIIRGAPRAWLRPLQPALDYPGSPLVRSLRGHSRRVRVVAINVDGRSAVSASLDRTVKVWNLETGRELRTFSLDSAVGLAVSADGRRALCVSHKKLTVWDIDTGHRHTLADDFELSGWWPQWEGTRNALSADGHLAISAAQDGTLRVWDVQAGKEIYTLIGHTRLIIDVALCADGRRAISASADGTLRVWNAEAGHHICTLTERAKSAVNHVAMSRDGRRAISASQNGVLTVWDVETGRALRALASHLEKVITVSLSADGCRILSGSDDTLKMWDVETGRELFCVEISTRDLETAALSADGRRAVSASAGGTLQIWDMETNSKQETLLNHRGWIRRVALSADGHRAVSASTDGKLKIWEVATGRELLTVTHSSSAASPPIGNLMAVAINADGSHAVSTSADWTLKLWDVNTGAELHTFSGHAGGPAGISISADGQRAVSASEDGTWVVWDVEMGNRLQVLAAHPKWAGTVWLGGVHSLSPDGCRALTLLDEGMCEVWDVDSGEQVHTLTIGRSGGRDVAISNDGGRLVAGSNSHFLIVWDAQSVPEVRMFAGHKGPITGVALSPEGHRAVSVSDDLTLKVWDMATGKALAAFTCDYRPCCCAIVDGLIIAGDAGGMIHFLRLEE